MIDRYLSPTELRRLISALLVVAVFICILLLFAFLIVPGTRNANAPSTESLVTAPQGESGWLDPTDYLAAKGRTVPPIDPRTVLTPNPELLARGRAIYAQTCATCHGPEGKGDGPGGKGLNPPPRHFTEKAGWKNGPGVPQIYQTLDKGIPSTSMVSYNYLSRRDRMALVHVVQGFAKFPLEPENPQGMEALGKLFASAGEVIPNRIPVAKAMVILAREAPAPEALDLTDPIVRSAVLDPTRAAQTLASRPDWRKGEPELRAALVQGLPGNGFSPRVAIYSRSEWSALHQALVKPR